MGRRKGKHRQRLKRTYQIVCGMAIAMVSIFVACTNNTNLDSNMAQKPAPIENELNIWWEQGYNLEEDEAFRQIVDRWQTQTGNRVKLAFFSSDELIAKAERAAKVNRLPDLMMSIKGNQVLYPRLAWEDKLADVTDIIKPLEDSYAEKTLQAITYTNAKQGKRSYYGIPVYQNTILIFYWQNILASIGLTPQDIPQDWDGFWQFWQQAQTKLKAERGRDIYGLGFTLAQDKTADDTHHLFEQILEANEINLLNDRGELQIDRPEIKQGIVKCLDWYAQLYDRGYIPPDAIEWSNADNNRYLLNRLALMTPNASMSIPATVINDPETYYNRLGIAEFPNKPNGQSMNYLLLIRQAAIFKDSLNKSLAKQFVSYFVQPEIAIEYFKLTGGRHQPVHKLVWLDPFWQNTQDPYLATATKIITTGQTHLSPESYNPAYSQVLAKNIWGQALTQVIVNKVSAEQAADNAIAQIKKIFTEWDN